jgi:Tfp pilus assembly protein PilN
MEEAQAVLRRLDRIERLDRARAPAGVLLAELRALLDEAEAWSHREGAGEEAVEACRAALERGGVGARAG